jgi:hypothetical protein
VHFKCFIYKLFNKADKFHSIADRISSKLQLNQSEMGFRPEVGPEIKIGHLLVTYSDGSSLSKRPNHVDRFGTKLWVLISSPFPPLLDPLGMTGWAESPGAAREHNEPLLGAVGTPDAGSVSQSS